MNYLRLTHTLFEKLKKKVNALGKISDEPGHFLSGQTIITRSFKLKVKSSTGHSSLKRYKNMGGGGG